MARVTMKKAALKELFESREVVGGLREKAEQMAGRVQAPSHLDVSTRAGVGPRGAFSQVIMSGPGALTWEYGNRSRAPRAPLRAALRSVR